MASSASGIAGSRVSTSPRQTPSPTALRADPLSAPDDDAEQAALMFCVDPIGLGGIALRACAGPARDAWLARLRDTLPAHEPLRRVPLHIGDERLLGGIDLAATLNAGHVVATRGVLAESDGGVVLLAMAERLELATAARIAAVIDTQECVTERDGVSRRAPCRIGVVALDEGIGDDERPSARLTERLAFHVMLGEGGQGHDLNRMSAGASHRASARNQVREARARLPSVRAPDDVVEALCNVALVLGVASLRAPLLALKAAHVSAALDGRSEVEESDAALAARLVLGPRATRLPPASTTDEHEECADPGRPPAEPESPPATSGDDTPAPRSGPAADSMQSEEAATRNDTLDEVVLEAALAAMPPDVLASLTGQPGHAARRAASGRTGALQASRWRGRPCGARREEPRGRARIDVIETLRAAIPWQLLRRRDPSPSVTGSNAPRIVVRREDFHVRRFRQRNETITVFVVDASGSAALHRLAETKGAVELLLADCYVRRDSVAVIAFRGSSAELLLPPTRSLVRAKRSLSALPGGGGTPLAAGIDAAATLVDSIVRKGATPIVVLLTDGRANISRSGTPGRALAMADALASASRLRSAGVVTLLIDTSPQRQDSAREMARALGGRYMPLPHAAAPALSRAVRDMAGGLSAEAPL